ncbi:hypothetical protein BJX76DRAFT_332295 [Aspergillus varians]
MPPLRTHRKSRTGCLQCKKRRVKCDEKGHPCGNCAFRKVQCTYPNPPTTHSSPEPSLPEPSPQQASQGTAETAHPPLAPLDPSNKLLIELMHKYCTETYTAFFSEPSDGHVWKTLIPRRALDHDFLLDGLLSVAALHTAFTSDRSAARPYLDAAMEFQSRALKPFQTALQNISPENCDAIFAHSLITIVNGIAFPQIAANTAEAEPSTVLENLFLLFELVQGTRVIKRMTGPWLQESPLIPRNFWGTWRAKDLDSDTDEALGRLDDLNRQENIGHPDRCAIIQTALSRLRQCFQRFFQLKDPASVLTWLATVDRGFVEYLRGQEPLPILIMVHWGVLLAQLDGKVWWASGSGTALVADALGILERRNADFGRASLWPREQLGL